jgi:predicted nucleotidyltransferase
VWLFGSRINDEARGGDVDLYVETDSPALLDELRCKVSLEEKLDMPVDLLVRSFQDDSPIARIAKNQGKRLD